MDADHHHHQQLHRFGELSAEWWNEDGPFKALHSMNPLRVPWIRDNALIEPGRQVLDVGCGAGLLSLPLARLGAKVTGLDASQEAIDAAIQHANTVEPNLMAEEERLVYRQGTIEDFAQLRNENRFDAVVASEIVEHVGDVPSFVAACVRSVKPGGRLFFTTINRTWLSRLVAISVAEDLFSVVPKGVHEWEMFVPPQDLTALLELNNCTVRQLMGMLYLPVLNRWRWIRSTQVSYALMAVKNKNSS